jgi:hypothetical protein
MVEREAGAGRVRARIEEKARRRAGFCMGAGELMQ